MSDHTRFSNDEEDLPTKAKNIELTAISVSVSTQDTTEDTPSSSKIQDPSTEHYRPRYAETQGFQTDQEWEDGEDLRTQKSGKCRDVRERFILVFLILIGLTCLALSFYRFSLAENSSGVALLIVGILTLTPGLYYAVKMYKLRGTNISVFDRN